jgi:hypothetical protein
MKVTLAAFASPSVVPVWGTSNYILHIPKYGNHKRTTQTPTIGGGSRAETPKQLKTDHLKSAAAKNLISKLKKHRLKGSGVAVI